ncbi:hypothetical protein ACRAWD_16445 [Caulobacter segnis]
MTWQGWAEIALTLSLAVAIGWPLGVFMSRVWNGELNLSRSGDAPGRGASSTPPAASIPRRARAGTPTR